MPGETGSYLFRQQPVGAVFQESFVPKQTVANVIESVLTRFVTSVFLFPVFNFIFYTNGRIDWQNVTVRDRWIKTADPMEHVTLRDGGWSIRNLKNLSKNSSFRAFETFSFLFL